MRKIFKRFHWLFVVLPVLLAGGLFATSVFAINGEFGNRLWPGNTLTIYSESGWAQSVRLGIQGINQSGMSMRLVLVDNPRRAQVRIYDDNRFRGDCAGGGTVGCAPVGYHLENSWVQLIRKRPGVVDRGQNRQLVMHELGHVLGLQHRTDGCQLMSPNLCSKTGLKRVEAGCPVDERFGLSRDGWCPGTRTEYQMCKPTVEAAYHLITLYGGKLPQGYNPWCQSKTREKSWLLDCVYPGWKSQYNIYPMPLAADGRTCARQTPSSGWIALGYAQRSARLAFIHLGLGKQKNRGDLWVREIRRLDDLARYCPRRYCHSKLPRIAPGQRELSWAASRQVLYGPKLPEF